MREKHKEGKGKIAERRKEEERGKRRKRKGKTTDKKRVWCVRPDREEWNVCRMWTTHV